MKTNMPYFNPLSYSFRPVFGGREKHLDGITKGFLHTCLAVFLASVFSLDSHAQSLSTGSLVLDRIAKRGSIHLGYRESAPPFSYLVAGGAQPVGYMWDLCGHLVSAVEQKLGGRLAIVPVPSNENSRIMLMKTGVIDFDCGASVNSVARQKQVGFSYNLYFSQLRVLVRSEEAIETLEQLADKRVVVLAGGIVERQLKQRALASNISVQMLLADTDMEATAMLVRGEADAFVGEDVLLAAQLARHAGKFRLTDIVLATEPFAIMMPRDDVVLKSLVDDALRPVMQGATLASTYEKWFLAPIPPRGEALGLPMSQSLKTGAANPVDTPVN